MGFPVGVANDSGVAVTRRKNGVLLFTSLIYKKIS
jgi:uncharacterized membrane protein